MPVNKTMLVAASCFIVGGLISLIPVNTAAGATGKVYKAGTRVHDVHLYHSSNMRDARVVSRTVVEPAAVVSRPLSEQPVHPHLIELTLDSTTIYLDPEADYLRQGMSRIDENHTFLKAQRLYRSRNAKPARVIWGKDAAKQSAAFMPEPLMILTKPSLWQDQPDAKPKAKPMPKVPASPKKKRADLMVKAEPNDFE